MIKREHNMDGLDCEPGYDSDVKVSAEDLSMTDHASHNLMGS